MHMHHKRTLLFCIPKEWKEAMKRASHRKFLRQWVFGRDFSGNIEKI